MPIGLLKRGLVLERIRLFELTAGCRIVIEERVVVTRFVEVDDRGIEILFRLVILFVFVLVELDLRVFELVTLRVVFVLREVAGLELLLVVLVTLFLLEEVVLLCLTRD